jgi:hypothetical protein
MSTRTPRDEHSEDESGETEYVWDSSDEKEEGDTKKTAYIWDSMDEGDRADTIEILKQTDEWVIWKTKDKWSVSLTVAGFHQLLYIKTDFQEECWESKIKGWWRTGHIRVKKPKKIFECWVKDKTKEPLGAQVAIITTLQAPNHNFGKDEYVVDMTRTHTHTHTHSLTQIIKHVVERLPLFLPHTTSPSTCPSTSTIFESKTSFSF